MTLSPIASRSVECYDWQRLCLISSPVVHRLASHDDSVLRCVRPAVRVIADRAIAVLSLLVMTSLVLLTSACTNAPTSPTTVEPPSTTEIFTGTLPVGGLAFYSFNTTQHGTISATLTSLLDLGQPSTLTLDIGIGVPRGTDCSAPNNVITAVTTTPAVTAVYDPAIYCARVYDIGSLVDPVVFTVTIQHPK